jgi:hypothetical protein
MVPSLKGGPGPVLGTNILRRRISPHPEGIQPEVGVSDLAWGHQTRDGVQGIFNPKQNSPILWWWREGVALAKGKVMRLGAGRGRPSPVLGMLSLSVSG